MSTGSKLRVEVKFILRILLVLSKLGKKEKNVYVVREKV